MIATGVNGDSRREILGFEVTSAEDGGGWLAFFNGLVACDLSEHCREDNQEPPGATERALREGRHCTAGRTFEHDVCVARWAWLSIAAVVVVLTGLFAILWWVLGQGTTAAIATIAAVPVAVAIAVVPPLWTRSKRDTNDHLTEPSLPTALHCMNST